MAALARAKSSRFVLVPVALLALVGAACGDGPGSEEELVTALTRENTFTQDEAECVASAVFAQWGEDEDALKLISAAADYDELTGPNGVEGFGESFETAVKACANLG